MTVALRAESRPTACNVINLLDERARPWIEAARHMQPLLRDCDVERMMGNKTTLTEVKAELFRMVTLDPAWVAEAVAYNKQDTDRAPIDQAQSNAGAATSDRVSAAPSASRPPILTAVMALISLFNSMVRGPRAEKILKGNSAPRSVSRCRVPKPGNSPNGNSVEGNNP